MADGPAGAVSPAARKPPVWTEIFRCFQVALDPRKLVVAAAGILAMSLGWYLLSLVFWYPAPKADAPEYSAKAFEGKKKSDGSAYSEDEAKIEGLKKLQRDEAQWQVLNGLAGPGGKIRSLPWKEYRGKNPYVFLTGLASLPNAQWFDASWGYFKEQLPVMAEPLAKLLLPIVKIADPNASPQTKAYLILVLFWSVAVWALAGGIITRIAAVQLGGKDRVSIADAVSFVTSRYLSYVLSPIVPVGVIGAIVVVICLVGLIALIPILGDLLYALGMPLIILGGIIMAILLIGLVGYPLMYTTLSTEGSDTFDALSRSYNYVFQSPWAYAWYWIVAICYGAVVTFFVVLVASLMVYLGKWAICQTPLGVTTNQKADYLFIDAPESFGWRELLLRGTDLQGRNLPATNQWIASDPDAAKKYEASYAWWNWIGAGMTTFWLTAVFLLMLGFSYSFFWSAATMVYLLMRKDVDEVDIDEVYLEDDEVPPPPSGPVIATVPPPLPVPTPGAPAPLPMVTGDDGKGTTPEIPKLPDTPKIG